MDRYIIGFFVLVFFWLKYFSTIKKSPKKILIVRLWALGSSLLSFPMIKQLEDYFGKNVQYDLLATSRNIGVFKNQGYFHKIYNLFSLKGIFRMLFSFKKYDIVIDVEEYYKISTFMSLWVGKKTVGFGNLWARKIGYTNPVTYNDSQHTVLTFLDLLRPLGIKTYIPKIMESLKYTEKDTVKVNKFLSQWAGSTILCMHTGGAETAKERAWPTNKWISLIKEILKKYHNMLIILSGTHFEIETAQNIFDGLNDSEQKNVINICGKFNLFEFAYLLKKCSVMISNDTGPMHLSAAMGTKTIGLFGPELPSKFGPYPVDKNIGLYRGDGNPCIQVHLAIWKKDKHYRVDKIMVNDVLHEIDSSLSR